MVLVIRFDGSDKDWGGLKVWGMGEGEGLARIGDGDVEGWGNGMWKMEKGFVSAGSMDGVCRLGMWGYRKYGDDGDV